jgi:hypothetical protein
MKGGTICRRTCSSTDRVTGSKQAVLALFVSYPPHQIALGAMKYRPGRFFAEAFYCGGDDGGAGASFTRWWRLD